MLTANIYILLRITNVDNFGVASHSGSDYENTSIWGSMAMVLRPFAQNGVDYFELRILFF
jgi:hypothetical protein